MSRLSTRATLTKLHMLLAAFIFPAIVMFLVTGSLYTWGVTGEYVSTDHPLTLTQPLANDETQLVSLAQTELDRLGISAPSGRPRVRSMGDAFQLEWTGSQRDVIVEPGATPLEATLIVKETSWYRYIVQLHKAKGGTVFKVYAAMLALSLFILVASGLAMALMVRAYRSMTLMASAAGVVAFVAALALS